MKTTDIKAYKKAYRLKNKEKILKQEAAQRAANPEATRERVRKYSQTIKGRLANLKCEAKRRNLNVTITYEQYVSLLKNNCYYCENSLPTNTVGSCLDRIDNKKGYEVDNVLPCCYDCNTLRMDRLTVEETKLLAITLRNFRNNQDEGDDE